MGGAMVKAAMGAAYSPPENCAPHIDSAAETVITDSLDGKTPAWFLTAYQGSDGGWGYSDLADLWSDARDLPDQPRRITYFLTSDMFGGYCTPLGPVLVSAFGKNSPPVKVPWRDGGCWPGLVRDLTVDAHADQLELTWAAPELAGASPKIKKYLIEIEWESTGQNSGSALHTEAVTHTDTENLVHTFITGLQANTTYTIRVAAVNDTYPDNYEWSSWTGQTSDATEPYGGL